jgi:DNA-directed RNA polymerase subunit RPC12/RpoP
MPYPMFTCLNCRVTSFVQLEYDTGDWIVRCRDCGAKNLVATVLLNDVPVPTVRIVAWKE